MRAGAAGEHRAASPISHMRAQMGPTLCPHLELGPDLAVFSN